MIRKGGIGWRCHNRGAGKLRFPEEQADGTRGQEGDLLLSHAGAWLMHAAKCRLGRFSGEGAQTDIHLGKAMLVIHGGVPKDKPETGRIVRQLCMSLQHKHIASFLSSHFLFPTGPGLQRR